MSLTFPARVGFTAPQISPTYDPQQLRTVLNEIARAIPPTITRTVTTATTITATDDTLLVDTTGGNVTVTLPAANQVQFLPVTIKNIGTNSTVFSGTIDGNSALTLAQYDVVVIQSNGVGWWMLSGSLGVLQRQWDYMVWDAGLWA